MKIYSLILLPILFLLYGCTESITETVVPPSNYAAAPGLKGVVIYAEPCSADNAELKVSHYEGLMKVPQPTFFGGMPKADRDRIKDMSVQIAQYNLLMPLEKSGAVFKKYSPDIKMERNSVRLLCSIKKIRVGIYDNGYDGFGSAGNYWEADTDFDGLSIIKNGKSAELEPISSHGQLKNAPVNPGTLMDALIISVKIAKNPIGEAFALNDIDYHLDTSAKSPVEIASYLAGIELAKQVAQKIRQF